MILAVGYLEDFSTCDALLAMGDSRLFTRGERSLLLDIIIDNDYHKYENDDQYE